MQNGVPSQTIFDLIANAATLMPTSAAILGLDRAPLTYAALTAQVRDTGAWLNRQGISRSDRVAVALPNGPEMATAFLSVAAAAVCAPLNPGYRLAEFSFFLEDLRAKALIVQADDRSAAREAAAQLNIPVLLLSASTTTAGEFLLTGPGGAPPAPPSIAQSTDIALVLHTSGTTARPKQVPLTQHNLIASAHNIRSTLQLTPADRCLNIMPLFHIHGLMASLLASLAAGAQVVCTPGFDAPRFLTWLHVCYPTWYTAVPTMHQAILKRAVANSETIDNASLRMIRSASASLPPQVMVALEHTFGVPVIEAYAMTEAAHQIASNPLPPHIRKPGSVGLAAGPEVAIMAEEEDVLLPSGQLGEIVVRGANIMAGYVNNPDANSRAFVAGWFRTGDQGQLDADGYLTIAGRLKEIINRAGEKISPREVDEALLNHPDVAQALAFGVPDAELGEDVAAAVVLRAPGVTESVLRRFVAQHLAHFKVPRRIVFVEEIPKGPTGKPQRIGLAQRLGLIEAHTTPETEPTDFIAPRSETEKLLTSLWCNVLGLSAVSINQRFLDLGGDSVQAMQLIVRVRQALGIELSIVDFFDAPTVADQALLVETILVQEIDALSERSDNENVAKDDESASLMLTTGSDHG